MAKIVTIKPIQKLQTLIQSQLCFYFQPAEWNALEAISLSLQSHLLAIIH